MDNQKLTEFPSIDEIENYTDNQKRDFYRKLQKICLSQKSKGGGSDTFKKLGFRLSPRLRKYDLDLYGDKNIPLNDSAVFICNHSNSHDFFTIIEVFGKIGKNVTTFGASDCLSPLTKQLFKWGDVTLIDRNSKESSINGMLEFSRKILEGKCGVILGESTWNLHPILPMQPIKIGVTNIAKITNKVIIPTIFEYVEVNDICKKENELYEKCLVLFGSPLEVTPEDSLFSKTKEIQSIMEKMRKELWDKLGIKRDSISSINKEIYLNHTFLKKFHAFGFVYDSKYESQFLFNAKNGLTANEFCLNQD